MALKFGGGPVGLSTLAVSLGEEPDTIEDVYEPYLLQLGFLQRTPRGRVITELGRAHIGSTKTKGACSERRDLDAGDGRPSRRARAADPAPRGGVQGGAFPDDAEVSIELLDGSLYRLKTLSAEPGFGFVSFSPHDEDGEPTEVVVPLGAIREVRIGAPSREQALGFSGSGTAVLTRHALAAVP